MTADGLPGMDCIWPGVFDRLFGLNTQTSRDRKFTSRSRRVFMKFRVFIVHSKPAWRPFRYTMKVENVQREVTGYYPEATTSYQPVFSTNESPQNHILYVRMSEHPKPYESLYSLAGGIRPFGCIEHSLCRFRTTLARGL